MRHILVIEDDRDVNALVVEALTSEGYDVQGIFDGISARNALRDRTPDLVILDLMLPFVDGSVLLREFRLRSNVPVLILTAKDLVYSKIDLLRTGADDYVTKPFDLGELSARVEALFRRGQLPRNGNTLEHGALSLDSSSARVTLASVPVELTATEMRILEFLLRDPDAIRSRAAIHEELWGVRFLGDDASIKTHVSNLRARLRAVDPAADPIETVRGLGYRLRAI